ncbi:MAG: site-2 protease family protein [Candidatus Methanomethylophilaceae archaeon]|nr:site-2 protease family protein [Candidatus Methanomethylophilaceae archaeon]
MQNLGRYHKIGATRVGSREGISIYDPLDRAINVNPNYGRMRFSDQEKREISIAVGVLTLAFSFILFRGPAIVNVTALNYLAYLLISFLLVLSGFMLHELAHKFMAQRYGAWAEFRMFPSGLMMALVFSMLGFLFAAPGAVYIQGRITEEQNGLISAAGPATNIVFGAISLLATWMVGSGVLAYVLLLLANINVFLGLFNLIPVHPLDGSKIFSWNPVAYLVLAASGGLMLLTIYGII